jgi:hypothetical protein
MLVVAIVDNRKGSLPQSQKRQHERSVEIEDHDVQSLQFFVGEGVLCQSLL